MRLILSSVILAALTAALTVGCASQPDAQEADWNDSQQRALDDPMNYRPEMNRTNITGGKIHEFDRQGFKRDMDSLLLN